MLAPSLGRVLVRHRPARCPGSASAIRPAAATTSNLTRLTVQYSHARRHSSSKASCPPGRPKTTPHPSAGSSAGKPGRRRSKEAAAAPLTDDSFIHFPSVPPTSHLSSTDVTLSSFFSLHRPISVTSSVPAARSEDAFNSMFESRPHGARRPQDVVSTLSSAVHKLDSASTSQDDKGLRWEVLHDSASNAEPTHHLDGTPQPQQPSIDSLLGQLVPFRAPPVPGPATDSSAEPSAAVAEAADHSDSATELDAKRRTWSVTVTVTESATPSGAKLCTATVSPLMRVPNPPATDAEDGPPGRRFVIQQPFLDRMRTRHQAWEQYRQDRAERGGGGGGGGGEQGEEEGGMVAISVKRQRRLKMKKHKYKKLMKRTRHIRRRLDRT